MRHYCTLFDQNHLPHGLALYQSLLAHAGDFEAVVLCLDEVAEKALHAKSLPRLRILSLAELAGRHPALAAARQDRTGREFAATCPAWLLRDLLPQVPAGELLTYLDAGVFFFSSPQPLLDAIGAASAALVPQGFPAGRPPLAHQGKFSASWVSLRHDPAGLAGAADWAERCAADCFTIPGIEDAPGQKHLDAWVAKFPGTVQIAHPGANVAPWNVASRGLGSATTGPLAGGQPLVFYHFRGLTHLGRQLYDPGLHRYGVEPDEVLRQQVYLPYLRLLAGEGGESPDIVPPLRPDDPRCGAALAQLLERTRAAEEERAACLRALEKNRADHRQFIADERAAVIERDRYTREVEVERDEQRQAFFDTRQKLLAFHEDLLRNIEYIKTLHTEADMLKQASVDREAYIATLNEQLSRPAAGAAGPDLGQLRNALEPFSRGIHRLVVLKYHPRLLPMIFCFSSLGVSVEVLDSPPELRGVRRSVVYFWGESFPEWLGLLHSLFDESAYLAAHPDVAAAVARGDVRSGWDHYQRFGQQEGRDTGTPHFRMGLADTDAVALDSADARLLIPHFAGRLQPCHQLFISSCFNPATLWLPEETNRTIVFSDLMCCPQPPRAWLGPLLPAAFPVPHRASPGPDDLYPPAPSQPAVWPVITVITACRNAATGLEATLRSVLDQHYPSLEYLVVDGGSTDGSVEIIKKYSGQLAWWTSAPTESQAQALNTGLAKSAGTILCWLNSGDRLAPGSLYTVAQQFLLHVPDLVAGRCARPAPPGTQGRPIHRNVLTFGTGQALPLAELLDLDRCWLQDWFFDQPEVFFSRQILERAGGRFREDLRHHLDYDLWVRMAKAGARIVPLPEILAIAGERPRPDTDATRLAELRAINADHRASP